MGSGSVCCGRGKLGPRLFNSRTVRARGAPLPTSRVFADLTEGNGCFGLNPDSLKTSGSGGSPGSPSGLTDGDVGGALARVYSS